eukprot:5950901-Pleurochrysis_carterae.AAC.1
MASHEGAGTPDERQRNLAKPQSELVRELSQLLQAAAIGGDYDKAIAILTAIKRGMTQQCEWSSAHAATSSRPNTAVNACP